LSWIEPVLIGTFIACLCGIFSLHSRLALLENRVRVLSEAMGNDGVGNALSGRVKALAEDPEKMIQAIKAYRDETGAGLVAAKKAIEDYRSKL
jgi:ribosomal protein L7/L12